MTAVVDALPLVLAPAVLWALAEAVRVASWRWVATVALLPGIGALAWFVAGRRQYGYGSARHPAPEQDA